jgi:aquaporin Z
MPLARDLSKKLAAPLVELVGTLFLVMTVSTTAGESLKSLNGTGALAPFAIGGILMVMIFAVGHISGAHYNPAVTLTVWLSGREKITTDKALYYVIAQSIGGILGGLLGLSLTDYDNIVPNPKNDPYKAFFAELFYTFALCWVVLNAATTKTQRGNSFFGLAIGNTVMAGAISVGHISGAVFNPAVAIGLYVSNSFCGGAYVSRWWIYIVSETMGACLAALFFWFCNLELEYPDTRKKAADAHSNVDKANVEAGTAKAADMTISIENVYPSSDNK